MRSVSNSFRYLIFERVQLRVRCLLIGNWLADFLAASVCDLSASSSPLHQIDDPPLTPLKKGGDSGINLLLDESHQ